MSETAVCSFVLRFVQNQEDDEINPWFGVVRHVQTSKELRFTDMNDALGFINDHLLTKSQCKEEIGDRESPALDGDW